MDRHPLELLLFRDSFRIYLQADALTPASIAVADPAPGNRLFDMVHAVVAVLAEQSAVDRVALRPLLFHFASTNLCLPQRHRNMRETLG